VIVFAMAAGRKVRSEWNDPPYPRSTPWHRQQTGTRSALMAIMGRMAAYTGQQITWEQAMESRQDLSSPRYDWDPQMPATPIAAPGVTRFE